MARYLQQQNGFTLVELIITATYTAAASAAIIGIFVAVDTLNRHARNLAIATAIAQEKIEVYRDAGYNAVAVGTPAETFTNRLPANFGGPKSAVANVTTIQSGLKRVEVVINYTENGRPKVVHATTLMAQRGINR